MYNRKQAEKELIKKYSFKSTGEKHEENYYTQWFQSYYLFTKFNIDKRLAHLSSLIVSEQITRKEAKAIVDERPVYPQLGIEQQVLKYPKHEYTDYATDEKLFLFIGNVIKKLRWLKNSLKTS